MWQTPGTIPSRSLHQVEWAQLMAGAVLFTLPATFLFIVAQRYFLEGISTTGFH